MNFSFTKDDIALCQSSLWDLTNNVLYKMCEQHPYHNDDQSIIAKTFIIGRSYAAAIERGRRFGKLENDDVDGDSFYTGDVVDVFKNSILDSKLMALEGKKLTIELIPDLIGIHHYLLQQLGTITAPNKRSFSSKYLHFHCPNLFFIYDSRVVSAIPKYVKKQSETLETYQARYLSDSAESVDEAYLDHFIRCFHLQAEISREHNILLTPRQIDNLLIERANATLKQKKRNRHFRHKSL